jgi:hypothetical protein
LIRPFVIYSGLTITKNASAILSTTIFLCTVILNYTVIATFFPSPKDNDKINLETAVMLIVVLLGCLLATYDNVGEDFASHSQSPYGGLGRRLNNERRQNRRNFYSRINELAGDIGRIFAQKILKLFVAIRNFISGKTSVATLSRGGENPVSRYSYVETQYGQEVVLDEDEST